MKITKSQLRQIIKEEIELQELFGFGQPKEEEVVFTPRQQQDILKKLMNDKKMITYAKMYKESLKKRDDTAAKMYQNAINKRIYEIASESALGQYGFDHQEYDPNNEHAASEDARHEVFIQFIKTVPTTDSGIVPTSRRDRTQIPTSM